LELYELLGRKGEVDAATLLVRDLHEVALQTLVAGQFDDAERGFRAILDKAPHDRPAQYLLEHTIVMRIELSATTPSREWRGVHIHPSKL
jgi:adenylate cyclase